MNYKLPQIKYLLIIFAKKTKWMFDAVLNATLNK